MKISKWNQFIWLGESLPVILVLFFTPLNAHAEYLLVIHTNDLHSHLDHASDSNRGGYGALKKVIDDLKAVAGDFGIETLVLDAGDFMEGSRHYMADEGQAVFEVMDAMGYDAVTIGNHDWLMGAERLDEILGNVHPNFDFLGANYRYNSNRTYIDEYLKPYASFRRAGSKIAVLGLTTDNLMYSWQTDPGYVSSSLWTAISWAPWLKKDHDYVFALTHMGFDEDKRMVYYTSDLDLVVGGHSHTMLEKPYIEYDWFWRQVPIVQAGEHGEYVGALLVDLNPGEPLRVVDYEMIPVSNPYRGSRDIFSLVDDTQEKLEDDYGYAWLHEVVGYAQEPIYSNSWGVTPWLDFVSASLNEAVDSDFSLEVAPFMGLPQPAGPITRQTLMSLYPRMFEFDQKLGWNVWTVDINGWVLKNLLRVLIASGYSVSFSGLTFDSFTFWGWEIIYNIQINGHWVWPWESYRVAISEGVARGAIEISPILEWIFRNPTNTGIPIWQALEERVARTGHLRKENMGATYQMHLE